ncbi:MAG: CAP domain-containing protein, partial [Acidimicrobiales bacterium]
MATLLVVVFVAAVLTAVSAPPAGAQGYDSGAEAQFIASINQLRTSKGLNALTVDGELTAGSRVWTDHMKAQGSISHAPDLSVGVTQNWQKLGENVGVGPTVSALMARMARPRAITLRFSKRPQITPPRGDASSMMAARAPLTQPNA